MKQQRKRLWFISLIFLLLLVVIPAAFAQESTPTLTLTVAGEDNPLIIRGRLDGQTNSFSGNVRLTVSGGDAADLRLLASDLQHDSLAALRIDRSNIAIPAGVNLSAGQPRDVRVTVNNLNRPGVYSGILKFLLPGQREADALVIPLEIYLDAVPKVVPVTPTLSWQVVRCDHWLDCRLAAWLLPPSATQDDWEVWLDNQTAQAVEVTGGVTVLHGARGGDTARADDVLLAVPHTLPANQVAPIAVTINRQQLAPDSYQGTLRFKLATVDEPVAIPTTIAVRQGPFWVLVVVLVGILLGRLVRDMERDTAQAQVKLLPEYLRLQAETNNLKEAEAKTDALAQLKDFKQRLDKGKETQEVLSPILEMIAARIRFYAGLETLADSLDSLDYTLKAKLAEKFTAARKAVRDGKQGDAEKYYAEIKQEIEKTAEDSSLRGDGKNVREAIVKELAALQENIERLATPVITKTTSIWLRLLAWLSGIRLNADVRFWVVRPILSLTLLVLLVLWGMQALYVTAGATFGAAGIYDYTALLLWGLTADVVSRSLSNLPAKLG
ncbi:MAG: hypothetical protein IPM39_04490 [Chloroflexi bacterium]|nr:hypothetical protein [Chloroflexota bacterium]